MTALPTAFPSRAARLALLVLPSVIVLTAVAVTTAVALAAQERSIRDATAQRVHAVATSLAELREVQTALALATDAGTSASPANARDLSEATAALQPLADLVERATGVYYVVVTDDEGVRITHPLPSERGERVATTNASVLAGVEFLGTETGASGPSLRAKVPVFNEGSVVGMVSVGVLEASIADELGDAVGELLPWVVAALVIATLASSLFSAAIERRFRHLDALAAEHQQLRQLTTALREQSHEHNTQLHVIHGLIAQGAGDDALRYIDGIEPVMTTTAERPLARHALLQATVSAVQTELSELGSGLELEVDDDATIDEGMLLVLANLCRNAGEAGARRVRCALRRSDGRLIGTVEDDGPGIDASDAEEVFARGFTSKPDPSGAGRGIGLDLVRRTVLARGGSVEVGRSELGGARFIFNVPAP